MTQSYRAQKNGQPVTERGFLVYIKRSRLLKQHFLKIREFNHIYNDQELKEILSLLKNIKSFHSETFQHSLNVAYLSCWLSIKLGMSHKEIENITFGALLHDIGKIKLSPYILDSIKKPDFREWQQIKKHPEYGVALLSRYPWSKNINSIIAFHHERMDGHGYYNLKKEEIPLNTKIVTVADAFDSMFYGRPYQKRRTLTQCLEELKVNSGIQFDAQIVEPFISITNDLFKKKYLI